jgi:hypothetical protein
MSALRCTKTCVIKSYKYIYHSKMMLLSSYCYVNTNINLKMLLLKYISSCED